VILSGCEPSFAAHLPQIRRGQDEVMPVEPGGSA